MPSFVPANAAVWFEIPATDLDRAKNFYSAVLNSEFTREDGPPNRMEMFASSGGDAVAGHLYAGKPAAAGTGPTIHLAVADLEAAMGRVGENGGQVVSPVIEIPAGRFAYCLDPDGNSFGLFA